MLEKLNAKVQDLSNYFDKGEQTDALLHPISNFFVKRENGGSEHVAPVS
ncbi:hypothetical protein PPTG_22642 [Phytophthora nicotianae INRA-310]|uniref:Uncharacterized protein n=2 Tax=Phytophthora nicotianae TaxID=4792 RepID=W2QD20_PHYN3|nr:hypothetical protein PPTG_22642 [Phytophthora nicotianae INRA-310]ETN11062.1 hypothetical protein PPTG_22642 [Phytophthora nicotianae INRA-310]ETO77814.1 hypothetical protein F444_07057 [Phytophthora nicotianae P1976]